MAIESAADREAMLSDWDSVVFSPGNTYPNRNDKTATISAIFDKAFAEVSGVETLSPMITCDEVNTPGVVYGSMVEKGTDKYKVISIQPDGTGLTSLLLEKQ